MSGFRAQQDALAGLRGPPTELMVQGGSNYRADKMRSSMGRPAAGRTSSHAPPAMSAVSAVLAQAEARLASAPSGPVHVHDLHETAMRTQQQLIERDLMVSRGQGTLLSPRPTRLGRARPPTPHSAPHHPLAPPAPLLPPPPIRFCASRPTF